MLFRALARTRDLWGVRSPAALQVTHHLTSTGHCRSPGHRCLSSGDSGRYANDPQVKEWMKELQKDFSHKAPQQEEGEGRMQEGKEEEEEDASDTVEERKDEGSKVQKAWKQLVAEKYEKLDTHSQIIYDYDEERQRREAGLWEEEEVVKKEKVKLERGETGVFDIEELVDLLREDNAQDLVVIQIPPELKYVHYMVIVSSSSQRHRMALAQLVKGAYKLKKASRDPSLILEGKGTDWVALDMGNIVLHIMKPETRESYDLEMLWAVGAEFDEKCQVSEDDLPGVRRPLATPTTLASPPTPSPPEAVT